jgi:hypothetical protein
LYFISDDDKTGSLYLGSKLISGGSSVTLDALEDILIENAIDG